MARRYELREAQWERLEDFLPGRRVMWVLRQRTTETQPVVALRRRREARWSGLPERFGKYKSVHRRFVRWLLRGKRILHELVRNRKNQYLMIDSTLVRAHQHAATGRKKGAD